MFTSGFGFAEIKIGNKLIIFGSVSKDSYKIELLQLLTIKKSFLILPHITIQGISRFKFFFWTRKLNLPFAKVSKWVSKLDGLNQPR